MIYVLHLLIVLPIYLIVTSSLNLLVGFAGKLSLAQGALYGLGGYTAALLSLRLGWPFAGLLAAALAVGMLGSIVLGRVVMRFRGEFFVLTTLAIQVVLQAVYLNWEKVTGGANGLAGIARPSIGSWQVDSLAGMASLYWVIAIVCLLLVRRWVRSPFGLAIQAVRDDERLFESLGKNPTKKLTVVFIIAGTSASLGGALLATYVTYIDSTNFGFMESVFFLSIVILGGSGTWQGPLLGSALLVLVPEFLRVIPLPQGSAPHLREIFFAGLLLLALRFRPQGLLGRYAVE